MTSTVESMSTLSSSIRSGSRKSARLAERDAVLRKNRDGFVEDSPQQVIEKAGVNFLPKNYKLVGCSRRRRTIGSTPFLAEGIIFNILVWLPADILYNVMRYVCRHWYNIINDPAFINAQLFRSTAGLLTQCFFGHNNSSLVEIERCNVHISELGFEFFGPVLASCNGLVLVYDEKAELRTRIYHIVNPVRKQQVTLPPLPVSGTKRLPSGLAYVPSTGDYKVVHVYYGDSRCILCCDMLTVGADSVWRQINLKHIYDESTANLLLSNPLYIGTSFYWTKHSATFGYVIALDAETEIFHKLPIPEDCKGGVCKFITKGSSLSYMDNPGGSLVLRVWALTDSKLGIWTKMFNINLAAQRCIPEEQMVLFGHLEVDPLVWLRNGEVVIFCVTRFGRPSNTFMVHDVKTGEFYSFEMKRMRSPLFYEHVNSLVWFRQENLLLLKNIH